MSTESMQKIKIHLIRMQIIYKNNINLLNKQSKFNFTFNCTFCFPYKFYRPYLDQWR